MTFFRASGINKSRISSRTQNETFVLSREQARETQLDFFGHPYYQISSALNGVVTSRIFKNFLPASPLAYLVVSDDGEGAREILGLATEPLGMVSLLDYDVEAYNRMVSSNGSMAEVIVTYKNIGNGMP